MNEAKFSPDNTPPSNADTLLKIFNYVGGALVFFGIVFFISVNWFSLNDFLKIFTTLGASLAAYVVGMLLYLDKKHDTAGSAFFMIAALTLPIGLYVSIDILSQISNIDKVNTSISAFCFTVFLLSHLFLPRTIFLLFTILFGSLFFSNLISLITNQATVVFKHLTEYEFLALGSSYLLLGRYLDLDNKFPLTGPLYFFGALFVLAASYSMGGMFCSSLPGLPFWKVMTALLILASFLFSVPLKSKSFLYLGAFFMVIYLTDMSSQFIDIFGHYGWPLLLILVGFLFMFTGYLVFNIHQKIKRENRAG